MKRLAILLMLSFVVTSAFAQTSEKITKGYHNPIIDHTFTADPTGVEYEGRQ